GLGPSAYILRGSLRSRLRMRVKCNVQPRASAIKWRPVGSFKGKRHATDASGNNDLRACCTQSCRARPYARPGGGAGKDVRSETVALGAAVASLAKIHGRVGRL